MQISTGRDIRGELAGQLYSLTRASEIALSPQAAEAWRALQADYRSLPPDEYLPGGLKYRFRRFDQFYFLPTSGELLLLPHTDYFQSADINQVTGGIIRKFAPLLPETVHNPFLHALIRFDFAHFPLAPGQQDTPWKVDVHLIRVVATPDLQGHPTPEGIHRDGAAFVTVHLAEFENVSGGAVSVYDDARQPIASFTLQQVLDSYFIDDAHVWHSAEPISPAKADSAAVRSILTFDFHPRPDLPRPE